MEPQIAFLDAMIARYRSFAAAPAAIFVIVLTMVRFIDDPLSGGFGACVLVVVAAAAYALLCSGLAVGRLHSLKLAVRRSQVADRLPPKAEREPSKDVLTRVMDWRFWDGSAWSDRLFAELVGVRLCRKDLRDLTVVEIEDELEGNETRALLASMISIIFFCLLLVFYFKDQAG
ncbi:MAG: hypothetical protein AAF366_09580 [Pseudomonadota bacterium]